MNISDYCDNILLNAIVFVLGDGRNGDNSLVVSMELNGVMYQGVLFAQTDGRNTTTATNNNTKAARSIVS